MPGTIQISVSDIVDLPPSSAPPSSTSISIRVTMGRREYKAGENGDISIPLTSLRENLLVKLVNSDEHEISQTGVETRLIVEKGVWDEIFQIEGGGKIRLKMQFVLSEEEQSRIRMMRLSALRKKHGDLINDSSKGPDKAAAVTRGVAAESPHNRGISVTRQKAEASVAESDASEVLQKEKLSPPEAATISDFHGDKTHSSESSASSAKVEQDAPGNTETQSFPEKNPSNVRKMISAFETSLSQDKRLSIKPPPTKPKPSKPEMEVLTSIQQSNEHANEGSAKVDPIGSLQIQHPAVHGKTARAEEMESPSISGRSPGMEPHGEKKQWKDKNLSSSMNGGAKLFSYLENMDKYSSERSGEWMFLDEPSNFCVTTARKKMMHLMEGQNTETGSCQEKGHTTISNTSGKQVGVFSKSDSEMNSRGWVKASTYRQRKPETSHSADAEPSDGPLGQVMKIAIMVGFGALVLFTRQGKNR